MGAHGESRQEEPRFPSNPIALGAACVVFFLTFVAGLLAQSEILLCAGFIPMLVTAGLTHSAQKNQKARAKHRAEAMSQPVIRPTPWIVVLRDGTVHRGQVHQIGKSHVSVLKDDESDPVVVPRHQIEVIDMDEMLS